MSIAGWGAEMVPRTSVVVPCAVCGVGVERQPARIARSRTGRFFCSKACRDAVGVKPRTIPDKVCEQCGVTFHPMTRHQVARFCSKPCYDEWQSRNRIKRICERCGVDYNIPAVRVGRKHGSRFCSRQCHALARIKHETGRTHNGRPVLRNQQGYLVVYEPDHPRAYQPQGHVLEHRLVAEQRLGRPLEPAEQVHHLNGDKEDNRPENLAVLDPTTHSRITLDEGSFRRREAQRRIRELEAVVAAYEAKFGPLPM